MSFSILIIDDDIVFCEELRETLQDYQTQLALDPQKALRILEAPNSVDLILLDVRLPGMKGTDLLKVLKERYPEIPVIIMTGFGSKDVILSALRNRSDEFIEKPIKVKELMTMIRRLLESKPQRKEFSRDIEYVRYYLQKNIDKKVELEDIARLIGYSTKYMSRYFLQETGTRFNDYRLNIKMDKAKEYLEETPYRIKQIAYMLGYENSESFVRMFKKKTEMTPSEYRKRHTDKHNETADSQ
jgi:YesN/AraC family two-component response regulator